MLNHRGYGKQADRSLHSLSAWQCQLAVSIFGPSGLNLACGLVAWVHCWLRCQSPDLKYI